MLRKLGLPVALAALFVVPVASRADSPYPEECTALAAAPQVLECDVPVPAGVDLGLVTTQVRVLVPDGYGDGTPVPVLYLLHGAGDDHTTWVDNTDVEDFARDDGVLIVMPDGGRSPDSGWYSDWADGSRAWETYHIDVLIPWVDASFDTLASRDHRGVAGLSMGGFGALSYAGRHPDLFSAAASFSGLLDSQATGPVEGYALALAHDYTGTPDSRVWGDPLLAADEWAAHNPATLARAGRLDHLVGNLWLTYGTGTPGGPAGDDPTNPAGYGIEGGVFLTSLSFKVNAALGGLEYEDLSYLGGLHDWPHWDYSLRLVLPELVDAID